MIHTKFQVSELSGSEEEDFLIFFYVFLWFERRTPGPNHLGLWDLYLNKLGTRQCYIPYFKHMSQAVLQKKIFKYISFLYTRPHATGPFWILGPPFEQFW